MIRSQLEPQNSKFGSRAKCTVGSSNHADGSLSFKTRDEIPDMDMWKGIVAVVIKYIAIVGILLSEGASAIFSMDLYSEFGRRQRGKVQCSGERSCGDNFFFPREKFPVTNFSSMALRSAGAN